MALILSENDLEGHGAARTHWLYNILDATITREVADALHPLLDADPGAKRIYHFSAALQSPALAMMLRGVAVDPVARAEAEKALEAEETARVQELAVVAAPYWKETERRKGKCADGKPHAWPRKRKMSGDSAGPSVEILAEEVPDAEATCARCGCPRLVAKGINPHSPAQMSKLLYRDLGLPVQHNHKTHKPSVDDECLDRLRRKDPAHAEVIDAILAARKARKQLGLIRARLDADGRWRSSFNVGAAVTGRWSSSKSPLGTGGNLQNVADRSRGIFVADPGLVLFYADYEQAESRVVALDAQDEAYIEAHDTGDVHTTVTRLVWPDAHPWTGVLDCGAVKHAENCCDRGMAEQPAFFDPHHDLRIYAKKVAHGSAIGMTPVGIARETHVKQDVARRAQEAFFRRFPRVRARQQEIMAEVRETAQLTSPLGRKRQFFGRLHDPATMREALAQTQQSMIVDWVSVALWRVWHELDTGLELGVVPHVGHPNRVWLLGQIHDALLGEVRFGDDGSLSRVLDLMSFGMTIHGRVLKIPVEIKVGRSWKKDDMRKWHEGFDWRAL
jgi:hypothetical protein